MTLRALVALLCLLFTSPAWAGEITLEMLDIGQGDALLMRNEAGKTVLIDAGPHKRTVKKMLEERGIKRLDMIIATHAHSDHIGGMQSVIENFDVGVYVDSGLPHTTGTYNRVMKAIEEKGIPYRAATKGQVFKFGDARFEVLSPQEPFLTGTRSDLNSNSVILRFVNGSDCVLFTGDAEEATEHQLITNDIQPCAVLKVAHHGGNHSSSAAFLDKLKPQIAIISAGVKNRYNHPGFKTLERLNQRNIKIYRTDTMGTLKLVSNGRGFKITSSGKNGAFAASAPNTAPEKYETHNGHGAPTHTAQASGGGGGVNLNTASASQLTTLPGIGPSKARAIIADREAKGPFPSVDALTRVKGIGKGTVKKFRDKVSVGGGAASAPPAKAYTSPTHTPTHAPTHTAQASGGGSGINLNAASASQLMTLPGIGPSKAKAIIADREAKGPFPSVDSLTRVKGIGKGTVKKFRDKVHVGGAAAPAPTHRPAPVHKTKTHTSPAPTHAAPAATGGGAGGINVNTASASQLTTLPGIGPAKARAIIADRDSKGPFPSCQGLSRVKGIGAKTVAKFASQCRTE